MSLTKQDFYEGAALYLLARTGQISGLGYDAPFFVLNGRIAVLVKYSTKIRSPWGFTFSLDEQSKLKTRARRTRTAIGLICGGDGVVALSYKAYASIAGPFSEAIHIACYRRHGEHYEVSGPIGPLENKIAPSSWRRLLEDTCDDNEAQ